MSLPQYVVDAFTSELFRGNPAAVCLLSQWLPDQQLQAIAAENNLSETAFLVPDGDEWQLRWFTPLVEIPLCGHATLASAFVLAELDPGLGHFRFQTLSGLLEVERSGEQFTLDFPARQLEVVPLQPAPASPPAPEFSELLRAESTLIGLLPDQAAVLAFRPDFAAIAALDCKGFIITAPGEDCDFVSRFFAPRVGINEDPVTGSAHCGLVPYWAERLGRRKLHARQLSARGGELFCELRENRVRIGGTAVLYSEGRILVPA